MAEKDKLSIVVTRKKSKELWNEMGTWEYYEQRILSHRLAISVVYTKPRDGMSVYHIRPRREQESNSSADINAADDNRPVVGHGGKVGVGRAA